MKLTESSKAFSTPKIVTLCLGYIFNKSDVHYNNVILNSFSFIRWHKFLAFLCKTLLNFLKHLIFHNRHNNFKQMHLLTHYGIWYVIWSMYIQHTSIYIDGSHLILLLVLLVHVPSAGAEVWKFERLWSNWILKCGFSTFFCASRGN